jgi:alkylation response protein AidB-like acyl-CoA dehydrogenase
VHRRLFDGDHDAFRRVVREFVRRDVEPHWQEWEQRRLIDRRAWLQAGEHGIIGLSIPEQYGGAGLADYRYRVVVAEELATIGAGSLMSSFGLQDDIVLPYFLSLASAEQKARWLPAMARGELIGAVAMTEPGAGSDLQGIRTSARRDGDAWILNGAKTFITSGIQSGVVIVVANSSPSGRARGLSLFVVEEGMQGFSRGRKLDKVGQHGQDTAELFFDDVRVPARNVLGEVDHGFLHLMQNLPMERLSIAVQAMTAARAALAWTVAYTKERTAFGKPLAAYQNTQFEIADMAAALDVFQHYLDAAVLALNAGELTAVDAAKAKLYGSELQKNVVDRCVQLFGGYGYMLEYPIARAYVDARIQTIYGGTSEIMKTIIGRDLTGLR